MSIDLTCLGTGDAFGSVGRHNAGYLVRTAETSLLLDAGPSVLVALKSLQLDLEPIDAVVISHLHGDHFAGVPFLLLDFTYETRRSRLLTIVGPPGVEERITTLYHTLYSERRGQPIPFPVKFIEVANGSTCEIADARIESFAVPHQMCELSLGHSVSSGGRSLVYSGDTPWTDDLIRQSSGADLFLCECSTFDSEVPRHVRYVELEANRKRLECRDILLVHIGREVRQRAGEIELPIADDGLVKKV